MPLGDVQLDDVELSKWPGACLSSAYIPILVIQQRF